MECSNSTQQGILKDAVLKRISAANRDYLSKRDDEEWMKGVCAVFPLRYANDLLRMIQESDQVKVEVIMPQAKVEASVDCAPDPDPRP